MDTTTVVRSSSAPLVVASPLPDARLIANDVLLLHVGRAEEEEDGPEEAELEVAPEGAELGVAPGEAELEVAP